MGSYVSDEAPHTHELPDNRTSVAIRRLRWLFIYVGEKEGPPIVWAANNVFKMAAPLAPLNVHPGSMTLPRRPQRL